MFSISTYLRTKSQSTPIDDALERLRAAVRQHVPLQPSSGARFASVHLASRPLAGERPRLHVDVLRLQMVKQLGAGVAIVLAAVPVADADEAAVAAPDARA